MPPESHHISEALQALQAGQEEGLHYLFTLYYRPLSHYAFRWMQDSGPAEEIASEAFLKLWQHREGLSAEGSVKAWLYQTVRHAAIDQLRKKKHTLVPLMQAEEPAEASPLEALIRTETLHQVWLLLQSLPPKCSLVFRLFYFEGKSHEEIAKALQLSPSTVRNQKARALRLLQSKMGYGLLLILLLRIANGF